MIPTFFQRLYPLNSLRPRRKQKINREQNVSSNGVSSRPQRPLAEAAMIFPLQRPSSSERPREPRQNQVQPIHQQAQNPVVTSIKRSIYSHVNELIAQNEERPESLARIFHDLQSMNQPPPPPTDEEVLANLNSTPRRPWTSMYDGIGNF